MSNRGIEWLYPFVDGAPPIGWDDARAYLVLPVLLVVVQYISSQLIATQPDPSDPNANAYKALNVFLPLMVRALGGRAPFPCEALPSDSCLRCLPYEDCLALRSLRSFKI